MTGLIRFEIEGAEARLTLCGPESGNAMRIADIVSASEYIRKAGRTPGVKVLRLCAEGPSFCLGRAAEPPSQSSPGPESIRDNLVQPILDLYKALHDLDIVSVAQVQGEARGFGCAMVAACDIAVASSVAIFSLPEMQKNLPPTLALSAVLQKMSHKAVTSLVLGAGSLDAQGALVAGLVGEVTSPEQLQPRGDEIVSHLSSRHPLALTTVKRYLRAAGAPDHQLHAEMAASLLSSAMVDIRQTKN